jgi:L-lactate utilization protein LutB
MEANLERVTDLKIERTVKALKKNNIEAFIAADSKEAVKIAASLMKEGDTISCGGSVTLKESGVADLMKSGSYNFLDRSRAQSPEEVNEIYRKVFSADVYLTTSNAVTESGELYNVDGTCNRIAAIAFGPKKVIFIVGINKLVRTLDDAIVRVKTVAAPPNTARLSKKTPCAETGECISLKTGGGMCSGCLSGDRICCNYLVSAYQRDPERMKVIIVKENLGY